MLSTRSPTFKHDTVKNPELARLGDVTILSLKGPDAEAFAQSQFMNDVAALDVGHWHWSGWLSAKGRLQALFALLRVTPGELWLVLPDTPPAGLCDALQRFVFRSKVQLTVRDDLGAFAEWSAPGDRARDRLIPGPDGAIGLDLSGDGANRTLWIAAQGDLAADAAASARWRDDDLRHGLPRSAASTEHGWTPHMLSLDRLKAFSVRKGCYPGQEIVARTHFLGQSKRQVWWIDGAGLAPGATLSDADGRAVGELFATTADRRGGLAVAALAAPGALNRGAETVHASPPLTGLARPI